MSINGVALIATKRFYFGVGGGTFEIERILNIYNASIKNKRLNFQVVKSYEDGLSNVRDVILLRWQNLL